MTIMKVAFLWFAAGAGWGTMMTTAQATLRDAVPIDFAVGGHIHGYNYDFATWQDNPYLGVADQEFNAISSSQYMAFNGVGDTTGFMHAVDWAISRGKRVHGHSLVYPEFNNRDYWNSEAFINSGKSIQDVVEEHLQALCQAGKGKVYLWDVVNEVFAHEYHLSSIVGHWGLRSDYQEYWNIQGQGDYVAWAFQQARSCDPDAILILLETNAEEEGMASDNIYNYVTTMRANGIPIDGVGFQMHVFGPKDWESVRRNFQRFADAGLRIFITEFDVMTEGGTTNVNDKPSHQQMVDQAAVFELVAEMARDMTAIESLYLWDYADDPSWMHPSPFALGSDPVGTYYFPTPYYGGYTYMTKKTSGTTAYDYAYDGLLKGLTTSGALFWERITSDWDPATGYIGVKGAQDRDGNWYPTSDTELTTLDESLWSLQWVFEDVNDGSYRLRCRWGDGYLTRVGTYDEGLGQWFPTYSVNVVSLDESWASQRWYLESGGNDNWRIINAWESGTGFLTRNGVADGIGGYTPGNSFQLYDRQDDWLSQYWTTPDV